MATNNPYFAQLTQQVDSILFRIRVYRDAQRVRNDILDLLKTIPSLQPRVGALGRSTTQILNLCGTVPITYNGAQYNIPVTIWIVEAYPFSPPVCFVTPTPDMIIKPKHKHVDSQGMCYFPYLSSWTPNTCSLYGLVQTMSKAFSEDPPVRAQPKQPPPPQQQTPPQQQQSNYPSHYSPYGNSGQYPNQSPYPNSNPYPNTNQYPNQSPYPTPTPQNNYQPQLPPNQPYENPADVAKRNVIRSVTEKLQASLHEFNTNTTKSIDELMAKTSAVEEKAARLEKEKEKLTSDKHQMDADMEDLTKRFEDIGQWLEQNDNSKPVDIDVITDPKDVLAKQLLTLVAEDATIEDTLYYLEKSLGSNEGLNLEAFLKSYRSLANEQFLKRATIKKVHEKQRGQ